MLEVSGEWPDWLEMRERRQKLNRPTCFNRGMQRTVSECTWNLEADRLRQQKTAAGAMRVVLVAFAKKKGKKKGHNVREMKVNGYGQWASGSVCMCVCVRVGVWLNATKYFLTCLPSRVEAAEMCNYTAHERGILSKHIWASSSMASLHPPFLPGRAQHKYFTLTSIKGVLWSNGQILWLVFERTVKFSPSFSGATILSHSGKRRYSIKLRKSEETHFYQLCRANRWQAVKFPSHLSLMRLDC